jgi:hypothetical protein
MIGGMRPRSEAGVIPGVKETGTVYRFDASRLDVARE